MKMNIIITVAILASIAAYGQQIVTTGGEKSIEARAIITYLKQTREFSAITNNLAQYQIHDDKWLVKRAVATNALASLLGANKQAVAALIDMAEAERQARDDVRDIAANLRRLLLANDGIIAAVEKLGERK